MYFKVTGVLIKEVTATNSTKPVPIYKLNFIVGEEF